MNLSQLMEAELPPIDYVVKDLLTPGCVMLAAKPKVGKSGFVLRLAIEVASGRPFLGRFDTKPSEVLYIAYEDEAPTIQERARQQLQQLGLRAPARLEVQHRWPSGPAGYQLLDEVIEDYAGDLRLIIVDDLRHFDPLVRSYGRDNKLIERIDAIGLAKGVCILVILHQGKGRVGNTRNWSWTDRIQGSGTGAARIIMGLEREEDATEGLLRTTGKAVPEHAIPLSWDGPSGLWEVLTEESRPELTAKQREVVEAVAKYPGRKAHELARLGGFDFEALRQLLRRMAALGHLRAIERRYWPASEGVQPWATEAEQTSIDGITSVDGRAVHCSLPEEEPWPENIPLMAADSGIEEWARARGVVA